MARTINWDARSLENRVLVECACCGRALGTTSGCPSCSAGRRFHPRIVRPRTLAGRIRAAWNRH